MRSSFLLKIHLYLALIISVPILWLSATGALLAFADNIDRILNLELTTVAPETEPFTHERMDGFVAKIAQQYNNYDILVVAYPNNRSDSLQTTLRSKTKGELKQIFINPYTGEILGKRNLADSFAVQITKLHSLNYDMPSWVRKLVLTIVIFLSLSTLMSGFWHFAERKLTHSNKYSGSQHALFGIILLLPLLIMHVSALIMLYTNQKIALLWHNGGLFGFGGRVVWLWIAIIFFVFIILSLHKFHANRNK